MEVLIIFIFILVMMASLGIGFPVGLMQELQILEELIGIMIETR